MTIEVLENKDLLITGEDFDKFLLGELYPNGFGIGSSESISKIMHEVLWSIGLYCRGFDGEKTSVASALKKAFVSIKESGVYYNIVYESLDSTERVLISLSHRATAKAIPLLNELVNILVDSTKLERVKNNKKPSVEKVLPFNVNRLRHNFNSIFSESFESTEAFVGYSSSPTYKNRIHIGHSIPLKDNSTGVAIFTTVDFN